MFAHVCLVFGNLLKAFVNLRNIVRKSSHWYGYIINKIINTWLPGSVDPMWNFSSRV